MSLPCRPPLLTAVLLMFSLVFLGAQTNPAYQLFTNKGKKISYRKMLKKMSKADIILFGEHHNNPICHWLELELTEDLASEDLVLGAEMFERDDEQALANYLGGVIDNKGLDSLARLWPNYKTDYQPIVDFAKKEKISFVSTNIPRKYASQVYKEGFESLENLSAEEKTWIAPLPIKYDPELPGYKQMLDMMPGHGGENFPKAQAIKDATMAHFILQHHQPGARFLHFNGTYHSDNFEGILWYLQQSAPDLEYVTISTVEQAQLKELAAEHLGKASFILVIPENMTKTY